MARKWSDEQRAEALRLYASEGMAAAHAATEVPKPTIKRWADEANVSGPEHSAEQTAAAVAAHQEKMAEKRRQVRHSLAATTDHLLSRIRDKDTTPSQTAQMATAVGILVDKLTIVGWGDGDTHTVGPDVEGLLAVGKQRAGHLRAVG